MSAICDAHKKMVVEQLHNAVHMKFIQLGIRRVGEKMLDWGTCLREAGPPVEQPRRTGKKRGYDQ